MRNCAHRLVLICSLKITVFRERSSSKTMSFKELLIFQDKYISVISRQMEATVLIILCNIFAARRTKCSRKVYLSMTGMITFQCSLVRLHKQTNMSLLCKNTKTLSYLEFTLSQFDPIGLIGYLSSHVQRAIVEWLLNIFTIVMTLTKKKKRRNTESEKVNVRHPEVA